MVYQKYIPIAKELDANDAMMSQARTHAVPGRFGLESFRSCVVSAQVISAWVVSALGHFGQIWWVVSAWFFQSPLG